VYIVLQEIAPQLLVREGPEFRQPIWASFPFNELLLRWRHQINSLFSQRPIDFLINQGRIESELLGERRDFIQDVHSPTNVPEFYQTVTGRLWQFAGWVIAGSREPPSFGEW
jgi:hypothetical protein